MEIDRNTYGESPAAIKLAEILAELDDKKIRKKVGKYYCHFCSGVLEIATLFDDDVREELFDLWRNKYKQLILEDSNFPEKVKSFLFNIMKAKINDTKKGLKNVNR